MLEKSQGDAQRTEMLEKRNDLLHVQVVKLNQTLENKSEYTAQVCDRCYDMMNQMQHKLWGVENDIGNYKNSLEGMEKRCKQDHYEF